MLQASTPGRQGRIDDGDCRICGFPRKIEHALRKHKRQESRQVSCLKRQGRSARGFQSAAMTRSRWRSDGEMTVPPDRDGRALEGPRSDGIGLFRARPRQQSISRQATSYLLSATNPLSVPQHLSDTVNRLIFSRKQNRPAQNDSERADLRNAFITFVTNWCKRVALRFSSLRYLTLS